MRAPRPPRNDRPIDRIRNSGGQIEVAGESGNIVRIFTLRDERIYFIRESGITSAQLADQIDPERKNPNIPQVVQRPELHYGATTDFIQRTICVAVELFDGAHLPRHVHKDDAIALSLKAAETLSGCEDNISRLRDSEKHVRNQISTRAIRLDVLPKTNNLSTDVESTISSLRKTALICQGICDIFYPREKNVNFSRHLRGIFNTRLEGTDPAWPAIERSFEALEKISNYRNAMIHDDQDKSLEVYDYEINESGEIVAPTLSIHHPSTPQDRVDVTQFLTHWLNEISIAFENYIVLLCDRNAVEMPGFLLSGIVDDGDVATSGTRFRWRSVLLGDVSSVVE